MTINHKKDFEDIQLSEQCMVNESAVAYQRRNIDMGITRMTTKEELDAECLSLEESKTKLIEKVHCHFHHS